MKINLKIQDQTLPPKFVLQVYQKCLVIHGCENVPKSKPGKYLEIENFVCNTLNEHLQLDSPLQANDLDIVHPLPSKKGTPVIVKFIRRTQKNEVYRKKDFSKELK